SIHLALGGLSRADDRREAARRLFMADGLIKAGITPEAILRALGSEPADAFVRFDAGQPRVPSGNGVESGRWTKIGGLLRGLTKSAAQFLMRMVALRLAVAGARLATNPYVLCAGILLIPRTTNLRVKGDVPEIPGLGYDWVSDETALRLT